MGEIVNPHRLVTRRGSTPTLIDVRQPMALVVWLAYRHARVVTCGRTVRICCGMRRRLRVVAAIVILGMATATVTGCDRPSLYEIGRAVAEDVDTLNGVPVLAVPAYWCSVHTESCADGDESPPASSLDASQITQGFADERGIPVSRGKPGESKCFETETSGAAAELYARFVRPPEIAGDSARVELATGCRGFEQIHEYVLRRHGRDWVVVRRTLSSIT